MARGWLFRDLYLRPSGTFQCGDGPRRSIDLRDFVNRYSSWSVSFEAEAQGKGKIGAKLEPKQAQQLSEAVQQAAEFRKYVVADITRARLPRINTPGSARASKRSTGWRAASGH